MRSFFTCEPFDHWVFLEMFFNNFIASDVLVQLEVSKLIGGLEGDDGGVPEEVGDGF